MPARRPKTQARRNNGSNRSGIPGWVWLIAGMLLCLALIIIAPRYLKSDSKDGFFRPQPNPNAQPASSNETDDDTVAPDTDAASAATTASEAPSKPTQYDFYTLLPGKEVALSDAELAASEREEAARQAQVKRDSVNHSTPNRPTTVTDAHSSDKTHAPTITTGTIPTTHNPQRYVLQAGAFAASGDAESLKASIALLGLTARVESADINGKTMYRVRMGPYGTASDLAEAKRKLANGGLPAMAIKAK